MASYSTYPEWQFYSGPMKHTKPAEKINLDSYRIDYRSIVHLAALPTF
ncbi:hypothetical protein CCACVL1_09284 [Corchorus capsularis]|uniref:Uncharacterized protein n=1 Tax=Corchorus capsularis TaxID=210143 RepID=A0A1R3IWV1_COCAP|nr:hypothetical protein CCACVL1_09284 [Corchorus capsularis]